KWPSPLEARATGGTVGHLPAGRPPLSCGPPSPEMNVPNRSPRDVVRLPAKSGARRNVPGSRDMAARVHVALSRQRQPGAECLGESVLEPCSTAGRAVTGAGDVLSGLDPEPGGEVSHAVLHFGPDPVLQRSDGQTGAAAERSQPEVADLRRILVVEISVCEQRHVGIAVQGGRRAYREPFVIERGRHAVEDPQDALAAVADPRMRVAVRDGLLAELLRGERRARIRADARDPLVDVVMDEIEPRDERPLQIRLAR